MKRYEILREVLHRDGLDIRPFFLMGYVLVWDFPEWQYAEVLGEYAAFVEDAPERVHANLCRYILRAGYDIGPSDYFAKVREEVERIEDRVSVKSGG